MVLVVTCGAYRHTFPVVDLEFDHGCWALVDTDVSVDVGAAWALVVTFLLGQDTEHSYWASIQAVFILQIFIRGTSRTGSVISTGQALARTGYTLAKLEVLIRRTTQALSG